MVRARDKSAPTNIKIPPHNIEAEQAVLGGVLINNEALNQLLDLLAPEDFYREAHASLYMGMLELYNLSEPIDVITLSRVIAKKGRTEKSGGNEYLASLVDAVSTSAGIIHHALIIKDLAVRRKLIAQCSTISDSCFKEWGETEALLEMAEQSIFDIAEEQVKEGFQPLNEVVRSSFKKLESVAGFDGYVTGVPSGFKDFDGYTSGLQPSDLIIIAARPSMGKTAFALNIALNAAKQIKKSVAVFSLEMSRQQLGIRLLGADARINATKLRTGYLAENDWSRLTESANRLSEMPIYIDDSSGSSALEMKAKCRRLKKRNDLGLVIIDYLQLIQGRRGAESRQIEISETSRMLKALAKDLNVPVIALSQLNRKVEDRPNKRPQMADLRESGAIEQDADVIAFIYRDEVYHPDSESNRNIAEIIIGKQRNGPVGSFKLTFIKEFTLFQDYTADVPPPI
jgi:replicative DNA helicase